MNNDIFSTLYPINFSHYVIVVDHVYHTCFGSELFIMICRGKDHCTLSLCVCVCVPWHTERWDFISWDVLVVCHRYVCCAGYLPCSGRCGESRCPEFCLCTEVWNLFNFLFSSANLHYFIQRFFSFFFHFNSFSFLLSMWIWVLLFLDASYFLKKMKIVQWDCSGDKLLTWAFYTYNKWGSFFILFTLHTCWRKDRSVCMCIESFSLMWDRKVLRFIRNGEKNSL